VLEVGGIGYRVFAAPSVVAAAVPGSTVKLHTYHLVREDQQALFGFRTSEELGFFNLLLTVTGVGPKVALAIVGSRPTADLQLAIMQQDHAVLVSIPGIGRKLAERVIFELKEKVNAAGVAASAAAAGGGAGAGEGEIVGALQALGYSLGEAREASRVALADTGVGSSLEERVKAALRSLLRD
jgi:Holliday junction DNA helicase RuvA